MAANDPLQRAASQGFEAAPTPEPTTEQVQRALHPLDYDAWKAEEEGKLRKAQEVKDASLAAGAKADDEAEKRRVAQATKDAQAAKERAAYQTRASTPAAKKEG